MGGRHEWKRWLVINAVIHSELRFLTWIFQASSADRTAKWQLGRSRQLGHITARAGGQPPLLHTYCKQFRLLLGSQINPGMHKAALLSPCHVGSGNIFHSSSSSVLFPTGCHFPVQRADIDSAGLQCPSNSCARSTERKKRQADRLLQLFPNSLAGLLSEHQTSLLALPLLLWPHSCRTVQTTAWVPYSLSQHAHPPTTGIPAVLAHESHYSRRRPIFLTQSAFSK